MGACLPSLTLALEVIVWPISTCQNEEIQLITPARENQKVRIQQSDRLFLR